MKNQLLNENLLKENNFNNYLVANQYCYTSIQQIPSLSEKMKAKIQRTKELLEKKKYKISENSNNNEYCNRKERKFEFNLDSPHEFSELSNNCNIKDRCPECIDIMSKINNKKKQALNNKKNISNTNDLNNNKNFVDGINCPKNNMKKENLNLIGEKNSQTITEKNVEIQNTGNLQHKALPFFENNSIIKNNLSINESFGSNGSNNIICEEISLNEVSNKNNLSKKELKMLRNRISAQVSRDRKKKEMDDLKLITQELFDQNIKLKKTLEEKDYQINEFKNFIDSLCLNCKGIINSQKRNNILIENKLLSKSYSNDNFINNGNSIKDQGEEKSQTIIQNANHIRNNLISNKRYRVSDFPTILNNGNRKIANNIKCGIMTGFLVIVFIVGSFAFNYGFDFTNKNEDFIIKSENSLTGRILQTDNKDVFSLFNNESSNKFIYKLMKINNILFIKI